MSEEFGLTSEERAARRRRFLTVVIIALIAFFVFWYAMSYVRADGERASSTSAQSSSTSGVPACSIDPKDVTVNVYNATDRAGLAGRVADELKGRGFDVELVANDPKQVPVPGVGQLRHGKVADGPAKLLMKHVGTFTDVQDERTRETVDVVLGEKFDGLVTASRVDC